jgi:hypothetical protein
VDKTTYKLRRKGLFCKADLVKLKTSFIQANKLRWKVYCVEDEKLGTFNNSQMDVEYFQFHIDKTGKVRNSILNHSL